MTMGVYAIRNRATGTLYIGSALDVERRWTQHHKSLDRRWKMATNKRLLNDWHRFGASAFDFIVIETHTCNADLMAAESSWIRSAQSAGVDLYNHNVSSRPARLFERIDYDAYKANSLATEPRISTVRKLATALSTHERT